MCGVCMCVFGECVCGGMKIFIDNRRTQEIWCSFLTFERKVFIQRAPLFLLLSGYCLLSESAYSTNIIGESQVHLILFTAS